MDPRAQLVADLRALMEAVRTSDLEQAAAAGVDLAEISDELRARTLALAPYAVEAIPTQLGLRDSLGRVGVDRVTPYADGAVLDFFPYSPITGELNAIAPPVRMWRDGDVVRGSARIPTSWNGPPAAVHGGFVAAVLDELLGMAGIVQGVGGFTGTLTVRYLKMTPIDTDLDMEASLAAVDGRKVVVTGHIAVEGDVCASAEATFIRRA